MRTTALSLATAFLFVSPALAERPSHEGKTLLFGNLHAHSKLSDDITSSGNELLPVKAYPYAHEHGLDFLAITDHHKAIDSDHRLFMTPADYQTKLLDVAAAYNAAHPGEFIAIAGFEWGNTATGNHVNVLGATSLPPDAILDVDYDALFAWARTNAEFIQLNHPNSWQGESGRNLAVGNFGEALYASTNEFAEALNPSVKAVAIICTVKGGHITGQHRRAENKTHREMQWENHYRRFLNKGFEIAPSADQDTHWRNWGSVTAARTAVWADSATYADLMKAFRANRVYATEDDELAVAYRVRYKGQTYWMGESVPLEDSEDDVELLVKVWQGDGSDGDSTNEGPYTLQLIFDEDGVGGTEASRIDTAFELQSGQEVTIPFHAARGQYLYLVVTEQSGKDNLIGDGEDIHVNGTGASGADGKRDDPNDSAWTAPIWFVQTGSPAPAPSTFVWSKNSSMYHDPTCFVVPTIGSANRREGPAPAGKTKHACHP
jgi:hypothetical protein